MKLSIEPSILYFGTPVVIISTLNEDGTTNIAPISAAWWLGWTCMIGIDGTSKTTENLKRNGHCVLNLASADLAEKTNQLARLTGCKDVPIHKRLLGYRYVQDKFSCSGFTPTPRDDDELRYVGECKIHLEAKVENFHELARNDERMAVPAYSIELKVNRILASSDVLDQHHCNKIDPNKWNPLIMSFRRLYGLTSELNQSRLAHKSEDLYAPWKRKGVLGAITSRVLKYSNRKYGH